MSTEQEFENAFLRARPDLLRAADQLQGFVDAALREQRVFFHGVAVRVKTVDSALKKIRKSGYTAPWEQMMDMVGGRVFTYFRSDAMKVEAVLRAHFEIDEANSSNKIDDLKFNAFGYTSRHLICRVRDDTQDLQLRSSRLRDLKFEFQIRSVLEHAWAEIEHELVYKAGTKPPDAIRRRFAASAAAVEIVEHEFERLREFELELAEQRRGALDDHLDEELDRAWMIAALSYVFDDRPSWHSDPTRDVFYHGREVAVLDDLRALGVDTVGRLVQRLKDERLTTLISRYAAARGIEVSGVSHLPIALFACALDNLSDLASEQRALLDTDARAALATLHGVPEDNAETNESESISHGVAKGDPSETMNAASEVTREEEAAITGSDGDSSERTHEQVAAATGDAMAVGAGAASDATGAGDKGEPS